MSKTTKKARVELRRRRKRSQERHVNLLLTSIIRAYPHHDDTQSIENRLVAAREALFGEKPKPGRPEINDEVALFHIFDEIRKRELDPLKRGVAKFLPEDKRFELEQEIDRGPMSVRKVAQERAKSATHYENRDPPSIADRLRRKAKASPLSDHDMGDIEGLIYGNSHYAILLSRIFQQLKEFGVEVDSHLAQKDED